MRQIDFKTATNLDNLKQIEQALLICFFHYKQTGEQQFDATMVQSLFSDFGYHKVNISRLKKSLIEKNKMREIKGKRKFLEIVPTVVQDLESKYTKIWNDQEKVESNSELLEESKFCGKRGYLDKIIRQINCSYGNHCFDACAVLMRRLFEIILILTYEHNGIESVIKNKDGSYFMLEGIVSNSVNNQILKIPARITKHYDLFRDVGNYSAHGITYTAGAKDINDIKLSYRVMLEDLFNRAGLL